MILCKHGIDEEEVREKVVKGQANNWCIGESYVREQCKPLFSSMLVIADDDNDILFWFCLTGQNTTAEDESSRESRPPADTVPEGAGVIHSLEGHGGQVGAAGGQGGAAAETQRRVITTWGESAVGCSMIFFVVCFSLYFLFVCFVSPFFCLCLFLVYFFVFVSFSCLYSLFSFPFPLLFYLFCFSFFFILFTFCF